MIGVRTAVVASLTGSALCLASGTASGAAGPRQPVAYAHATVHPPQASLQRTSTSAHSPRSPLAKPQLVLSPAKSWGGMVTTRSRAQGSKGARSRSPVPRPVSLRGGKDGAAMNSGDGEGDSGGPNVLKLFASGEVQLLVCAALYGSLTVAFRLLYSLDGPPAASMASFVRGVLAAACFIPAIMQKPGAKEKPKNAAFWFAAAELAWWNLGAQGLQNVGLMYTEASRASFLTQTSVVLTPVLSIFAGEKVGGNVWGACVLALIGVVTIARAESGAAAAAATSAIGGINFGDLLCLAGAASWSMYILRLTRFAQLGVPAIALQAWKTIILGGFYGLWACYDAFYAGGFGPLWVGATSIAAWAILAYSAVGPGAVADVMQNQAQEKVKASQANVILSSEPLMAALLGVLILGETLPLAAAGGGLLIVLASLIASGVIGGGGGEDKE